jgi:hypothetical protein
MKRAIQFTLGCLIAAALSDGAAQAQFGRNPYQFWNSQLNAYNSFTNGRNPYLSNMNSFQLMQLQSQQGGLSLGGNWASQMMNSNAAAQVYGTDYGIPLNYSAVANYYAPAYYPSYYPSYVPPMVNPYAYGGYGYGMGMANPYAPAGAGYGVGANPYAPVGGDPSNPYSPYNPYNPYNPLANPAVGPGVTLMGSADVMKAFGSVITAQEQARIMREQALQAKLETKKKAFDLDMYIKANTPTYTQAQAKAERDTLVRIQANSLPGEIQSGKSLNYLLKDLSKYPTKLGEGKIPLEPIALSETVLGHVNVVGKGTHGMGLLRDDGRITWPTAIQLNANQQKNLEAQIKSLVTNAYKGKNLDKNVLKDVRAEMDQLKEELVKNVNAIPMTQYMAAKRFFNEFEHATTALENEEAPLQAKFQKFVDSGRSGRSVQELAEYMVKEGLRFGPATADDEAAYRAVHAAMAAYDLAMNAQLGIDVAKDQ